MSNISAKTKRLNKILIKRKQPITLIELMFVIFFIALLSGVFSIPITKAYKEQRFRSDVHRLVQQLRLAQDLMLLFHANMTLTINLDDNKNYLYKLSSDVKLPKKWESILNQQQGNFSYIDNIILNSAKAPSNEIVIKFYSGGSLMSKEDLILSNKAGMKRFIHLRGYPSIIKSSLKLENFSNELQETKQDEELTKQIREEIQSDS